MRTGPHIPECAHGTPGPERHECVCWQVLEDRRRKALEAWYAEAAAYTGTGVLRTELVGLLRNIAATERRCEALVDKYRNAPCCPQCGADNYEPEGQGLSALEAKNKRRRERVAQIRGKLLGLGL